MQIVIFQDVCDKTTYHLAREVCPNVYDMRHLRNYTLRGIATLCHQLALRGANPDYWNESTRQTIEKEIKKRWPEKNKSKPL